MKRLLILFFLLSFFSLFMLSCASSWTKNNGSFVQDNEIKTMFETHEYVSDYNYFYTVSVYDNYPEAIVGIKEDYEIVKENSASDGELTLIWGRGPEAAFQLSNSIFCLLSSVFCLLLSNPFSTETAGISASAETNYHVIVLCRFDRSHAPTCPARKKIGPSS